jgi:hypothetical protein
MKNISAENLFTGLMECKPKIPSDFVGKGLKSNWKNSLKKYLQYLVIRTAGQKWPIMVNSDHSNPLSVSSEGFHTKPNQ